MFNPTASNFFAEFILLFPVLVFIANIASFVNYGKSHFSLQYVHDEHKEAFQ